MFGISSAESCMLTVEDIISRLQTDICYGLKTDEATARQKSFGENDFTADQESSLLQKYIEQFKDPMILLLLLSACMSVLTSQYDDAISITLAIVIVVTVAFIQEYRSEQSLQKLKKLVPPHCNCIRDGILDEFFAKDLVVGDIVHLNTGDRIPADIRLFETTDLAVDEASFTGESKPARKREGVCPDNTVFSRRNNVVYMGTLVKCGHGKGIVVSIGEMTEFGSIFKAMQNEEAPKTPLQMNMDALGKQLSFYSLIMISIIALVGWFQGKSIIDMFTIGVSLAVAAIPEGLPIVVTVTLALGVMRMARRNTIVKRLPAVETLGCVDVICCDKTGTLTKNEMKVVEIVPSNREHIKYISDHYETGGSRVDYKTVFTLRPALHKLIEVAVCCNNAQLTRHGAHGSPTESALIDCANKLGLLQSILMEYKRLEEWPFNSDVKMMSVKCVNQHGKITYFIKGAIEKVLDKCTHSLTNDGHSVSLSISNRNDNNELAKELAWRGLRVLGYAYSQDGKSYTYTGMTGIMDPPRHDALEAVMALRQCGVKTVMITGDAKETALAIAQNLSIFGEKDSNLSGEELDQMSDSELTSTVSQVSVFYRTTPQHKTRIIKCLRAAGHVVGMTGDGVNDAVALKSADIGIAMGVTGTDVCKEAADVILVNDEFLALITAIEGGRGIFHNIRNFVRFQLSTSIAALSIIAISTLFGLPNPLNPMQILWINILMDGPPAQSLGVEPVDPNVTKQPPRKVKEHIVTPKLIGSVIMSALIIVSGTLYVFYKEMDEDGITPRDTTMTFTCFVFFDMFNALSCRSQTKFFFEFGLCSNSMFVLAVTGSLVGQLLVIYFPPLQSIFQTEALYFSDLIFLVCLTSSVFLVGEFKKLLWRFWGRKRHSQTDLTTFNVV